MTPPDGDLGALTLATDRRPAAVSPYLGVREQVWAVAGTDESPHGTTVLRVDPSDGDSSLEVTNESGAGWSLPAVPDSMAPDDYAFTTVFPPGLERALDFHETDDGMELRFGSHRLQRTTTE